MRVEIRDKKSKKVFLDAEIWILKEWGINDLQLLIIFKVAFMSTYMFIAHGMAESKDFDKEFYEKLKIELRIFEANQKDPDNKMVKIKEVLNKLMLSNFEKEYSLEILEM